METNLERLDKLFPDVLVLNPEQVGKALGWDRKKIYRAIEARSFPFPVLRTGNLISVPKLGFAKWLDDGMPDAAEPTQPPPASVPVEPPKRKRGRPRKALSVSSFQSELRGELERHILKEAIADALAMLKPREDDEETEGVRNGLREALGVAEAIRERTSLSNGPAGKAKPPKRGP